MTHRREEQQQEIRQGATSHLTFNNNIYIGSPKWGHQRADGTVNRSTLRGREREREAIVNCLCKRVIRFLFSVHIFCVCVCPFSPVCQYFASIRSCASLLVFTVFVSISVLLSWDTRTKRLTSSFPKWCWAGSGSLKNHRTDFTKHSLYIAMEQILFTFCGRSGSWMWIRIGFKHGSNTTRKTSTWWSHRQCGYDGGPRLRPHPM